MSKPVIAPCPHCAADVRIRVEMQSAGVGAHLNPTYIPMASGPSSVPKVVWTPAACPECRRVYHGTETWALGQAQPAGERF